MKQSKFLAALLLMFFFLFNCSGEASIELSEELENDNFEIIETKFVEDDGVYFIITNKPLSVDLITYDYVVTLYENSSYNFFDSFRSIFGSVDKDREIAKYPLPKSIPHVMPTTNSNYEFINPSSIYRLDIGNLSKTDIIDRIVISRESRYGK